MTLNSFTRRLEDMVAQGDDGSYVTLDLGSSGQVRKMRIGDVSPAGEAVTIADVCRTAEVDLGGREVRLVRQGETKLIQVGDYEQTPLLHGDRVAIFDKETGN